MDALNTKIKNIKTEKTLKVRPENIKSGVSIFGINGSVTELNGETATVTPTTSSQTVTPTGTGKNALTSVTVNAVTNAIDNNITAGNIKNGVTILGVQGSYSGLDTSDANATASDILQGKTAYVNGTKITGTYVASPSYPPDWSELGYTDTPGMIIKDFNYAKDIKDNWDSSITNMNSKYYNNRTMGLFPSVDTSNVTNMQYCFGNCIFLECIGNINSSNVTNMDSMFLSDNRLVDVPQLNTSKVTNVYNMFNGCMNLSTTSLNNILGMAININPNYSKAKTLYEFGFRSNYYTMETWQALPNWQAFINAGWTTGF